MMKFLFKTALAVGVVGLALEGVKKALEKRDETQDTNENENLEEQYVTLPTGTDQEAQEETVEPIVEPAQEETVEPIVEQTEAKTVTEQQDSQNTQAE